MNIELTSMCIKNANASVLFTYDLGDEKWYVGSSVAKMVGYENPRNAIIAHVDSQNKRTVNIGRFLQNGESYKVNSAYVFINDIGASQLVSRSRLIDDETKSSILMEFGVSSMVLPKDTKELQFFELLSKFTDYEIIRQYKVDNYILDGYIQDLNLAIEYDESYHRHKNQYINDKRREDYIKTKLKCKFIRLSDRYSAKENVEILLSFIENIDVDQADKCDELLYTRCLLKDINNLQINISHLVNENTRLKKIVKYFLDRDKKEFIIRNDIREIPTDTIKYKKFLQDITNRLVGRDTIYKDVRVPDYYEKEEDFYA